MAEEGNDAQGESSKLQSVRFGEENRVNPPDYTGGNSNTVHHLQPHVRNSSRQRSVSRGRSRATRGPNRELANKGPLIHSSKPPPLEGHHQKGADPSTSRPHRASPARPVQAHQQVDARNRSKRSGIPIQHEHQPQTRSWAAVAKSATKGYTLSYIPPHKIDNRVVAEISDDMLEDADPKWKDCLVGYFIGRKLPFRLVEEALKHIWGSQLQEVRANDDGFYFMHIPDSEYRRSILDGGCFTIARVPLILQQFTPLVDLQRAKHQSVPIWIKLRNVPYSLWSPRGLSAIASGVGKPLYVDSRTEKMTLLSFARVCVEIEGGATLPNHVDVHLLNEVRTVNVEYEWKPSFCSTCATFGHKCPSPPPPSPEVDVPIRDTPATQHSMDPDIDGDGNGAWTEVGRRKSSPPGNQVADDAGRKVTMVIGLTAQAGDIQPDMNRNKAVLHATSSISEDEENLEKDIQEDDASSEEDVNSVAADQEVVKSSIPEEVILSKSAKKKAKKKGKLQTTHTDVSSSSNVEVPKPQAAARGGRNSRARK